MERHERETSVASHFMRVYCACAVVLCVFTDRLFPLFLPFLPFLPFLLSLFLCFSLSLFL